MGKRLAIAARLARSLVSIFGARFQLHHHCTRPSVSAVTMPQLHPPFPETPLNVWRGRTFHPRTCKLEKLNMYQHQSVMLVYHTFARSH